MSTTDPGVMFGLPDVHFLRNCRVDIASAICSAICSRMYWQDFGLAATVACTGPCRRTWRNGMRTAFLCEQYGWSEDEWICWSVVHNGHHLGHKGGEHLLSEPRRPQLEKHGVEDLTGDADHSLPCHSHMGGIRWFECHVQPFSERYLFTAFSSTLEEIPRSLHAPMKLVP